MIELVIAALFQIASITGNPAPAPSAEGGSTAVPASTVDGGTGNWDDNN